MKLSLCQLPDNRLGGRFIDCRWIDPKTANNALASQQFMGSLQPAPAAKWEGNGLGKDWKPTHWMRVGPPTHAPKGEGE